MTGPFVTQPLTAKLRAERQFQRAHNQSLQRQQMKKHGERLQAQQRAAMRLKQSHRPGVGS